MSLTLEQKQVLFANEVTRELIDIIRHANEVNRGRNQAQLGVVQHTTHQLIDVSSTVAGTVPVLGAAPVVLGAVANFAVNAYYSNKQAKRSSVINLNVLDVLDTTLHDEIKQAALFLSRFFRDFFATHLHEKSIKTIADCIADRIFNHMTKVAQADTPASFWSCDVCCGLIKTDTQ